MPARKTSPLPRTAERLPRLRRLIAGKADGMLICRRENVRYLSGFTGTAGYLVVGPRIACLVVDARYEVQAAEETSPLGAALQLVRIHGSRFDEGLVEALRLAELAGRRVGFESHHLTWSVHRHWHEVLCCALVPLYEPVETLRLLKDAAEVAAIRAAGQIMGQAFAELRAIAMPGMSELELAAELGCRMRRHGAEAEAFEAIVASGPRSAMPHARPSGRRLEVGDLVLVDFGARYGGYLADATRTWVLGQPDPRQQTILDAVQDALQTTIAAIRPGLGARELDALARQQLRAHGLAEHFPHALGHGLGLEIHEDPSLSPEGDLVLEVGMVLALEPGVYFPGWGGVRVEQTVRVTGKGGEVLTDFPLY